MIVWYCQQYLPTCMRICFGVKQKLMRFIKKKVASEMPSDLHHFWSFSVPLNHVAKIRICFFPKRKEEVAHKI